MSKKKPTVAAVEKVIRDYEKLVFNPVKGWMALMDPETSHTAFDYWLGDDLDMVHRGLRILRDDVAHGLVDWEEA